MRRNDQTLERPVSSRSKMNGGRIFWLSRGVFAEKLGIGVAIIVLRMYSE